MEEKFGENLVSDIVSLIENYWAMFVESSTYTQFTKLPTRTDFVM